MERILHQLRLVVYPMIYKVLYIPGGCLVFLPSTDSKLLPCAEAKAQKSVAPGPGMFSSTPRALTLWTDSFKLIVDFIMHHHVGNGKRYEKVFRFNIRFFHGFWISKGQLFLKCLILYRRLICFQDWRIQNLWPLSTGMLHSLESCPESYPGITAQIIPMVLNLKPCFEASGESYLRIIPPMLHAFLTPVLRNGHIDCLPTTTEITCSGSTKKSYTLQAGCFFISTPVGLYLTIFSINSYKMARISALCYI